MKIALLRQRVTALGGAETTLSYLVRGLAAAGHEVTVYGAERRPRPRRRWGRAWPTCGCRSGAARRSGS